MISLFSMLSLSGDGVDPARVEGVALQEPADPQGGPPEETVLVDGFPGVGGASRVISATVAQKRGQGQLVCPDQEKRDGLHDTIRLYEIVAKADM